MRIREQQESSASSEKTRGVTEVLRGGRLIRLEDGSEWEVYFMDSIKSGMWLPTAARVILREGVGYPFPYNDVLVRVDSRQKVNARRIG